MTKLRSTSSRFLPMALAAGLALFSGCGSTVDPPDTAEVIRDPAKTPPAKETEPAKSPETTPTSDVRKN